MTYRADYLLGPPPAARFTVPDAVDGSAWIYLHLDASNDVLYVGKTTVPESRTRTHEASSPWWDQIVDMVWFGPIPQFDAVSVEKELIRAIDAPHNVQHTSRAISARQTPAERRAALQARVDRLAEQLARAEAALTRHDATEVSA